jgi:hypothetical protein
MWMGRIDISEPGSASFIREITKRINPITLELTSAPWNKLIKYLNSLKTKGYVVDP